MSNELTKPPPRELDGFDTYESGVEGEHERASDAVIQGPIIAFTNEAEWVRRDGEELPADLELVAVDVLRVVREWPNDGGPPKTTVLAPGQKFPDIKKLNAETSKSEWREGPAGNLVGPWEAAHIVRLLNVETMDRFSYPTATIGGSIAVSDLVERTQWTRRFRGANVYPVVTLSDTFMPTRHGGRQRPHFVITNWLRLGGDGETLAVAGPVTNPPSKAKTTNTSPKQESVQTVDPPSTKEVTGDEIPW